MGVSPRRRPARRPIPGVNASLSPAASATSWPDRRLLHTLGYGGPTQGALGHVRPRQRPVPPRASNKLPRPRTAPEAGSPVVATFWRWFGPSLCRRARARERGIMCITGKRDLSRLSHWSKLHSRPEKRSQAVIGWTRIGASRPYTSARSQAISASGSVVVVHHTLPFCNSGGRRR